MSISEAFDTDSQKKAKGIKLSKQTKQLLIFAGILFFLLLVLFLLLNSGKKDVAITADAVDTTVEIVDRSAEIVTPPELNNEMFDIAAISEVQGVQPPLQNDLGDSVKASLDEKKSVALIEEQEQDVVNSRNEEMKKFLNSIKNEIYITSENKFVYQNKTYSVGDFISDIQVVDIDKDYIRFSGESWSYVLRFF
ncbi:MAG: hypothetical protein LBG67_00125 [Campylobacteraceae bacterium]|jgi:hypothetical protein|nr:hypothetical protein [Campylobacteraceae bacterium]